MNIAGDWMNHLFATRTTGSPHCAQGQSDCSLLCFLVVRKHHQVLVKPVACTKLSTLQNLSRISLELY